MADTNTKQQIVDKIKDNSNVLVTVSSNPSVDELSAALGITLLINKMNKHATAVYSGTTPPAIEFLEPEKTFENSVDSLRDFIIALDKSKADHLRYKVVDDMVKIFITPYRMTISEKDLDFSQGDYNVEVVLAIGVKTEEDLDKALESHGRILHDATVAAISLDEPTNLGGIEWLDKSASSYSEMMVMLADELKSDKNLIDEQIATALLTGIVAATERFSNSRTSSKVMTSAAKLMAAGANQQLIATKLQEGSALPVADAASSGDSSDEDSTKIPHDVEPAPEPAPVDQVAADGSLAISHEPQGTVDEVAAQVAEANSQEALARVEEGLQKTTEQVVATQQADATAAAEQELANSIAATAPQTASSLRGAVAADQWQGAAQPMTEPIMGGTLNATSEQAADDKRRQIEEDRNRTILSHGRSGYVTGEPSYQAPINAVSGATADEPSVPDILSQGQTAAPTAYAAAIQPPAPVEASHTLAEIDAQNRAQQSTAMDAVNMALDAPASASLPEPMQAHVPDASVPAAPFPVMPGEDALPPVVPALPPMPDFSTLPPLPGASTLPALGDTLPPIGPIGSGPEPIGVGATDPGQFRIPGQ